MQDRLQPALLGGLFIGVLSALPVVNVGNCCCCLWVIVGGVLATYLRQQNSPLRVDAAEGALVGLFAGVIGGVLWAVLSMVLEVALGPMQRELLERFAASPDFPPEAREIFDNLAAGGAMSVAVRVASAVFSIFVGAIFGMLGGLLGVAIFKKDTPPPGTVQVLPPQ